MKQNSAAQNTFADFIVTNNTRVSDVELASYFSTAICQICQYDFCPVGWDCKNTSTACLQMDKTSTNMCAGYDTK